MMYRAVNTPKLRNATSPSSPPPPRHLGNMNVCNSKISIHSRMRFVLFLMKVNDTNELSIVCASWCNVHMKI